MSRPKRSAYYDLGHNGKDFFDDLFRTSTSQVDEASNLGQRDFGLTWGRAWHGIQRRFSILGEGNSFRSFTRAVRGKEVEALLCYALLLYQGKMSRLLVAAASRPSLLLNGRHDSRPPWARAVRRPLGAGLHSKQQWVALKEYSIFGAGPCTQCSGFSWVGALHQEHENRNHVGWAG